MMKEFKEVIMPLEEAEQKLANQEFEDSKTIIGLRETFAYFGMRPGK